MSGFFSLGLVLGSDPELDPVDLKCLFLTQNKSVPAATLIAT
jgi:hypothetical protein